MFVCVGAERERIHHENSAINSGAQRKPTNASHGIQASAAPFARSMAMLMSVRMRMRWIDPMHSFRLLHRLDIWQVDSNRLAVAAHEDALELLVR